MNYDKMTIKDISLWLAGVGILLASFSCWAGNSNVLTAGYSHTCGIKTDSTIVCWGDDSMGQTTSPSGTFSQISAGISHTCGIKTGGTISCWGENGSGQSSQPPGTYLQVVAGTAHTCALKRDSTVICWGSNSSSQSSPLPGVFTQITAGDDFTCGLKPNKMVECWGNAPTLPTNTFTSISAGYDGVCGLKTDGTGTCWGERLSYDTLGFISQIDRGIGYSYNSSYFGGICGIKSDKTVECWNLSEEPQSGTFTYVATGNRHACGLRNNGVVACWGDNGNSRATPPTGVTFKQPGAVVGIPPSSCTQAELNAKYSVGYKAGVAAAGGKTIKLTNISTRALVQGGAYNVIAGFIITGTGTQKVLIRAWGLEAEVDTLLTLQTYPAGTTLATNNNWQTDSRASEIPANMKPTGTTDAAIFINLQAGAYTAMMSTTGSKGLGLIGVDAID